MNLENRPSLLNEQNDPPLTERQLDLAHQESAIAPSTPGKNRAKRGSSQFLVPVLTLVIALIVWQLITAFQLVSPIALPTPLSVWQTLITLLTIGFAGQTIFTDIGVSALRIAVGFVAAVIIGVPLGILMGRSQVIFRVIDPFLQFIRPVPPLAYIPLLVVWFGIGELPKIVLILIGTLPAIIISTVSGVRGTPIQRIRVAQCLGATPLQLFWHTILPSALPEIFTGMRIGIGIAWSCLVAAEFIAADAGLGYLVQYAGNQLQVGIIFVGIIMIGLLGYAMELVIRGLERIAVPWKGHV
jgi:NitT/TauT family transport system permease protein/taurine transport system permease protein